MTSIAETPLARLENEARLINATVKAPGTQAKRFLYRGELAIKFAQVTERESRPPELKAEQVIASATAGEKELPFFSCYLLSFESLAPMTALLGDMLGANGKYFAFCSNIDLAAKYRVKMGNATFFVLPLEESTVYNELLELVNLDRDGLKKRDANGKVEAIVNAVAKFSPKYEEITYERGLQVMQAPKDPGANRPV
jgi:hypothetical protein